MGFLHVLWLIDDVDVIGNFVVRIPVCIYNYKIESRQFVRYRPASSDLHYVTEREKASATVSYLSLKLCGLTPVHKYKVDAGPCLFKDRKEQVGR